MTNFDSDKVIILYYAIGAGGKFLAHNLSLSPDCVMMNSKLAIMQLEGKLDQKQKVSILLESIKNTGSEWTDFGFNDIDWFGLDFDTMSEQLGVVSYHHLPESELKSKVYTNPDFQYLTVNNTKYLFITSHSKDEVNKLASVWKNAKIISFKNEKLFCRIRSLRNRQLQYKTIWSLIPEREKDGWLEPPFSHNDFLNHPKDTQITVLKYLKNPEFTKKVEKLLKDDYSLQTPKTFTEYKSLSSQEKKVLESHHTTEEYVHPNSIFVWDCNWYLSEQNTLHSIKCLYDVLELRGYDRQSIGSCYRSWIKKLEEII